MTELSKDALYSFADSLKEEIGLQSFALILRDSQTIELASMIVSKESGRNQGKGTQAMNKLLTFADRHNCRVVLSPGLKDDHNGTTSRSRLVKFYKRFGFYENKGRKKDFSISCSMIREPKAYNHDNAENYEDDSRAKFTF